MLVPRTFFVISVRHRRADVLFITAASCRIIFLFTTFLPYPSHLNDFATQVTLEKVWKQPPPLQLLNLLESRFVGISIQLYVIFSAKIPLLPLNFSSPLKRYCAERSTFFAQLLPVFQLMYCNTLSDFKTIVPFSLECAMFLSFCSEKKKNTKWCWVVG